MRALSGKVKEEEGEENAGTGTGTAGYWEDISMYTMLLEIVFNCINVPGGS